MVDSVKKQMQPKTFYEKPLNKSKGILDDFAVRKSIASREGYFNSVKMSSFTPGSVLFIDSDLKIAENNPEFFWDNTNQHLGINTTTPTARLEVAVGTTAKGISVTRTAGGADTLYMGYPANNEGALSNSVDSGATFRSILTLGNRQIRLMCGDVNTIIASNISTKIGDGVTDYVEISSTTGDLTFVGAAGFYPRTVSQSSAPTAGTGATQCDTGEFMIWEDSDNTETWLVYNRGGTVKGIKVENI